jgi:hypothetical protein
VAGPTKRHTPQPARVSLAELRGFLEIALRDFWLDLGLDTRRSAKQHEQKEPVEIVSSLHRYLPSPRRDVLDIIAASNRFAAISARSTGAGEAV